MLCKVIAEGINVFLWPMTLALPLYTPPSHETTLVSPYYDDHHFYWHELLHECFKISSSTVWVPIDQRTVSGKEVVTSCLICLIHTDDVSWYPPFFHSFDTLRIQLNTYKLLSCAFCLSLSLFPSFAAYSTDVKLRSGPFMAAVAPKKCLYRNGDLSP